MEHSVEIIVQGQLPNAQANLVVANGKIGHAVEEEVSQVGVCVEAAQVALPDIPNPDKLEPNRIL